MWAAPDECYLTRQVSTIKLTKCFTVSQKWRSDKICWAIKFVTLHEPVGHRSFSATFRRRLTLVIVSLVSILSWRRRPWPWASVLTSHWRSRPRTSILWRPWETQVGSREVVSTLEILKCDLEKFINYVTQIRRFFDSTLSYHNGCFSYIFKRIVIKVDTSTLVAWSHFWILLYEHSTFNSCHKCKKSFTKG